MMKVNNILVTAKVNEYIYDYEKSSNKFIRFCNITFFVIRFVVEYVKGCYTSDEVEFINNGIRNYKYKTKEINND